MARLSRGREAELCMLDTGGAASGGQLWSPVWQPIAVSRWHGRKSKFHKTDDCMARNIEQKKKKKRKKERKKERKKLVYFIKHGV